jgi:hypothetical protein
MISTLGERVHVSRKSRIAIHRPHAVNGMPIPAYMGRPIQHLYDHLNVSRRFWGTVLATPPTQLRVINEGDSSAWGLRWRWTD